ncbi:MAG: rRNA pseudouridine synthase [Oscillospiraceae bacterium]|nr:rRNA pseudouridine synthase [Oscillospiraceae bacterium]
MKERLQKIISSSGYASRRAGEELIRAGRVTVNGNVASLGDMADPDTDIVAVDGVSLTAVSRRTYIMLNKPRGYVTTMSDEKGRKCVAELVRDVGARVYPVGRLDMYSEGLLIMTDDGDFANRLMHPSGVESKTYHAYISGECSDEALRLLRSPLVIDGYKISPAKVTVLSRDPNGALLEICIHEGRNRQIRKMCEAAGIKLIRLRRVAEANFVLGSLKTGHWRHLTREELQVFFENQTE